MANRNADVNSVERLEAEARVIMWEHSQIAPRGFDSVKARERLHREFDEVIDRWAVSRLMLALEHMDAS